MHILDQLSSLTIRLDQVNKSAKMSLQWKWLGCSRLLGIHFYQHLIECELSIGTGKYDLS